MSATAESPAVVWDGVINSYVPDDGPLRPMTVEHWSAEEGVEPDGITYEVIRHRLYGVVEEQGLAIIKVSGSPVATFAHDFATTLFTSDAEVVYFGPWNQPQVGTIDRNVKWILENRADSPGIKDGDMFLGNDPWIGANHQSDVCVVCPVFWEGKLFAWVGSAMHTSDVGGSTPGGFCPDAESVYEEPLPTPPVKYVENGEIRRDVEDMFLRRSRLPDLLRLDLLALISSNNVAKQRMLDLLERYGPEAVRGSMAKVIDDSERLFAKRLELIPDGEWAHHFYVDIAGLTDRGLYQIVTRVRKQGDRLTFDNEGTHAQAGALNTTAGSWRSAILSAINPLMCWDMMYATGGPMRRVSFEATPGTVMSASHPGSVSNSSVGVLLAITLGTITVSKMLASSTDPALRRRAMGTSSAMFPVSIMSGIDRSGAPYGTLNMDPMGGGLGAFPNQDGSNTGGHLWDPISLMPNVEYAEQYFPVLFLFRRELADSGGAGKFRGGNSGAICLSPHKIDGVTVDISASGWAVPIGEGLLGGHPTVTNGARLVTGSSLADKFGAGTVPQELEDLDGTLAALPPKLRSLQIVEGDVFELWWNGGGGFGDPLTRDPDLVAKDVAEGMVTVEHAARAYGVVVKDGEADLDATRDLRKSRQSTAGERESAEPDPIPVVSDDGKSWLCPGCGEVIGENTDDGYLSKTVVHDDTIDGISRLNRPPSEFVDPEVIFRSHACPGCGQRVEAYLTVPSVADLKPHTRIDGKVTTT